MIEQEIEEEDNTAQEACEQLTAANSQVSETSNYVTNLLRTIEDLNEEIKVKSALA